MVGGASQIVSRIRHKIQNVTVHKLTVDEADVWRRKRNEGVQLVDERKHETVRQRGADDDATDGVPHETELRDTSGELLTPHKAAHLVREAQPHRGEIAIRAVLIRCAQQRVRSERRKHRDETIAEEAQIGGAPAKAVDKDDDVNGRAAIDAARRE